MASSTDLRDSSEPQWAGEPVDDEDLEFVTCGIKPIVTSANTRQPISGGTRSSGSHRAEAQTELSNKTNSDLADGSHRAEVSKDKTHQDAFPTEQKERERDKKNELKEKGIVVEKKKKTFYVEDHHDDCGDDLASIDLLAEEDDSDHEEVQEAKDQEVLLMQAYPVTYPIDPSTIAQPQLGSNPAPGRDPRAPKTDQSKCPACKGNLRRDDWTHTRKIGECSFPYDKPWLPECIACQKRIDRYGKGHTYEHGKCKWATAPVRASAKRQGGVHEPMTRVTDEPTSTAPTTTKDDQGVSRELGQNAEEEVQQSDAAASSSGAASSSSGSHRAEGGEARGGSHRAESSGSSGPPRIQHRGQNPERPDDWTNFDIGRVVRLFRANHSDAANRLTLRKLHVRWWHASHHTMKRLLERAGVPERVLKLIPEVTQSCQVCREWSRPGPRNACNAEFADAFNQQVECDLLFIHKQSIFHMIDRCTRWHAACLVADKTEETLTEAIDKLWVTIHGPPGELIMDGEAGVVRSDYTNRYLTRKGIKLHPKGKDQHAPHIERRGALLRDTVLKILSQLRVEGLEDTPFSSVLADAVFCGNAMLSINKSTPYAAVYGRVPQLLPSIDNITPPDAHRDPPLVRHADRLREISIQAMIEGTTRARLNRTTNTKTTPAGEKLDLKIGSEVDFFRPPGAKNVTGWYGPAKVVDASNIHRGVVTLRYQNQLTETQTSHVRHHQHFLCLLAAPLVRPTHHTSVWETLCRTAEEIPSGTYKHFGHVNHGGSWIWSSNNSKHPGAFEAIRFYAENHLRVGPVVGARLGKGIHDLAPVAHFTEAIVLMWKPGQQARRITELKAENNVIGKLHIAQDHLDWQNLRVLQLLLGAEEVEIAHDDLRGSHRAEAEEHPGGSHRAETSDAQSSHRLSTIPEELSDDSQVGLDTYIQHEDPEFHQALCGEAANWEEHLVPVSGSTRAEAHDEPEGIPLDYFREQADSQEHIPPSYLGAIVHSHDDVELEFDASAALGIPDLWQISPDEVAIYKTDNKGTRRAVTKRDDDILTADELKKYWREIQAAMLAELMTWRKFKCFSRRKRS